MLAAQQSILRLYVLGSADGWYLNSGCDFEPMSPFPVSQSV